MSGEPSGEAMQASARRSLFAHPVFVAGSLWIVVGLLQLWIMTDGNFRGWARQTIYYPMLTDAFLHGQLSLRVEPNAELLALKDPYDPVANQPYRWHDAVLFGGKYYIYWGPVPALLAAGSGSANYNDQELDFVFLFGVVVMATILLMQARARWFPQLGAWTVWPAVLSLGLSDAVLRTRGVYGAAIAAGQFFLLAGICAAWLGMRGGQFRLPWFLLAGICWALSGGSRVSLPPALLGVAVITGWEIWRSEPTKRWGVISAMAIPLLTGAGLMAIYNYERFGSVTDFGWQNQLAGHNQHAGGGRASARYVMPSLLRYLLEPPGLRRGFPFVWARDRANGTWVDSIFALPRDYGLDPVVGLFWAQPFLVFALVALKKGVGHPYGKWPHGKWLVGCLLVAGVLGILPSLAIEFSASRYLMDGVPCFSVLGGIGYLWVLSAGGERRKWVEIATGAVVIVQCAMGMLLAINESFPLTK